MSSPGLIDVQANETPQEATAKISFQPDVIILLFGSFDASLAPQIRSVCARAIGPVALTANALIITNGSSAGLAALMGQAAQQLDQSPSLLGILEPNVADPDPNHTIVMRLPADGVDPAKFSFLVTAELTKKQPTGQKPIISVLFGDGGEREKILMLRCARRGWPILVVQGAGVLGDELLKAVTPGDDGTLPPPPDDPDLRELISSATICPLPLDGDVDDLKRVLFAPLQQPGDVLIDVWRRYDDLDVAAIQKQGLFRTTQLAIISLAVIATFLAIVMSFGASDHFRTQLLATVPWVHVLHPLRALHIFLIVVPITISILVAFNSRFREGNKWLLLRAAAESTKREIFRYRTKAGAYSEEQCTRISAESKLAANIKDISTNLIQSEVNRSSLPHRPVNDASRLTFLTPDDYLRVRIEDQIGYFVGKTAKLYKQLKWLQMGILLAGGIGTFLAAVGFDVWVALTTAFATAFTTKLEIDQVENSLVQYNIALTNLRNIESWWKALSTWEKTRHKNIDLLVDQAEKTLERETVGWVQQMQSTLDKLMEKQADSDSGRQSSQKN